MGIKQLDDADLPNRLTPVTNPARSGATYLSHVAYYVQDLSNLGPVGPSDTHHQ
ncbi:hypothetical protein [Luteimonas qiangzhengi]|uniref:hypothetical protein n=1 Tax=Luteimonas sp. MJ146 TaxID=3129240 RepID=UPI0031B9B69F